MNHSSIDLHSNSNVVTVINETDRVVAEDVRPAYWQLESADLRGAHAAGVHERRAQI